jgi:hypothetical protein
MRNRGESCCFTGVSYLGIGGIGESCPQMLGKSIILMLQPIRSSDIRGLHLSSYGPCFPYCKPRKFISSTTKQVLPLHNEKLCPVLPCVVLVPSPSLLHWPIAPPHHGSLGKRWQGLRNCSIELLSLKPEDVWRDHSTFENPFYFPIFTSQTVLQ